jgi:hypothetical protein
VSSRGGFLFDSFEMVAMMGLMAAAVVVMVVLAALASGITQTGSPFFVHVFSGTR